MKPDRKVFDAHFHIGSSATRQFAGRTITPILDGDDHQSSADVERYIERHGLGGGVMIPTYLEDQKAAFRYNDIILEAVRPERSLYGALWVSPLPENEERTATVLERLPQPGIRALKMASNTWKEHTVDPSSWNRNLRSNLERILSTATDCSLVIHFHTGYHTSADPLQFDAFLSEYGTAATYQLAHMGEAIAPALRFVPRFVEWIEKGYDVFTDTSVVPGFAPRWLIQQLEERGHPVDRVLFATDTPWGRFPAEYWKVEGLEVDGEIKTKIFWDNAAALYAVRGRERAAL